ncbi:MAG: hypothetical protein MHPSP_004261, partial [Paramarteilia canceri]
INSKFPNLKNSLPAADCFSECPDLQNLVNSMFCMKKIRTNGIDLICQDLPIICGHHNSDHQNESNEQVNSKELNENELCYFPYELIDFKSSKLQPFCLELKSECDRHFEWEILFLSKIDSDIVQCIYQIENLDKESKTLEKRLSSRKMLNAIDSIFESTD